MLPNSIAGSRHPPSLLKILHALTSHEETLVVVAESSRLVVVLIQCIAMSAEIDVVKMLFDVLATLLSHNGGKLLLPHCEVRVVALLRKSYLIDELSRY